MIPPWDRQQRLPILQVAEIVGNSSRMMPRKFVIAMSCYAALAVLVFFTLDGVIREALCILLGGLAVKTWIAQRAGW